MAKQAMTNQQAVQALSKFLYYGRAHIPTELQEAVRLALYALGQQEPTICKEVASGDCHEPG